MVTLKLDPRLLAGPLPENLLVLREEPRLLVIQVPAGRSVNQTLKDHNLAITQAVAALVNGQTTDLEATLAPGDQVRLLPQIAGGD